MICVVSFKLKVISTIYIVSYEIGTSVIDHYNMTIVHENHVPFLFFLSKQFCLSLDTICLQYLINMDVCL